MIFYFSVLMAVASSWWFAAKARLPAQEWFILFLMIFLGLWSGFNFWIEACRWLASVIWAAV